MLFDLNLGPFLKEIWEVDVNLVSSKDINNLT